MAPQVRTEEQTAAYRLFHHPFRIRVAEKHLITEDEIESVGTRITGLADVDDALAGQLTEVQRTIAFMVELNRHHIPFYLVSPRDSVRIYKTLTEHIRDLHDFHRSNLDHGAFPRDDVIAMDNLAKEVFKSAKVYLNTEEETTEFRERLIKASPFKNTRRKVIGVGEEHKSLVEPEVAGNGLNTKLGTTPEVDIFGGGPRMPSTSKKWS